MTLRRHLKVSALDIYYLLLLQPPASVQILEGFDFGIRRIIVKIELMMIVFRMSG